MEEAGEKEEDCEGGGEAFGGGIEPEGVGDYGDLLDVYDTGGEPVCTDMSHLVGFKLYPQLLTAFTPN